MKYMTAVRHFTRMIYHAHLRIPMSNLSNLFRGNPSVKPWDPARLSPLRFCRRRGQTDFVLRDENRSRAGVMRSAWRLFL